MGGVRAGAGFGEIMIPFDTHQTSLRDDMICINIFLPIKRPDGTEYTLWTEYTSWAEYTLWAKYTLWDEIHIMGWNTYIVFG